MGRLIVFNSVSLDGFFVDAKGDMSWAHNPIQDEEWNKYVESNTSGTGALVFGRITYELMKNYWPTPEAKRRDPIVAERMNAYRKIVFSRTLKSVEWANTLLSKNDPVTEIGNLKRTSGDQMVILGSGSLVSQLTQAGLIDEYQVVIIPIILGSGRTLFEGVHTVMPMQLTQSRSFKNGNVVLFYNPRRS